MEKIKNVTTYSRIAGIYFKKILKTIISIADLDKRDVVILDFGCGHGVLKGMLGSEKVINYDIVTHLSDIDDWKKVDFDVVVVNEVFYSFSREQLNETLRAFREKSCDMELIVGMSRQSWLNEFGKFILGYNDAHDGTLIKPEEELAIIKQHMRMVKHASVFMLMDIYSFRFDD